MAERRRGAGLRRRWLRRMKNIDEQLIIQLESKKDGANVHTINKTITYYKIAARQDSPSMERIEQAARAALATGDFKPCAELLRNCW